MPIRTGETLEVGIPRPLFDLAVSPNTLVDYRNQYVTAADGQRFLVTAILTEATSTPITVILNWQSMLR